MSIIAPGPETRVYQPAELNREVKLHLEAGFPRLWLSGEISNLARPPSGHVYFSLKDARAQIRCALFRGNAAGLGFRPENGMQVLVRGRVSFYEPRGDYQLIADGMLEAGAGAMAQAFEALKRKLENEGLFDETHKQPLPRWPRRISVVTSPSGAAVRDILQTLHRRWPRADVRVYPSQVQGDAAPAELVRALRAAERHGFGEVILLARGGGSIEDLWAFNDEALARAVHACRIPVVSGIGHETDFTITDFVADLRAPTPTAAAVAATPDGPELLGQIGRQDARLRRAIDGVLMQRAQRLDHAEGRLRRQHPERRLDELERRRRDAEARMQRAARRLIDRQAREVTGLDSRLAARHPGRQLDRLDQARQALHARLARAGHRMLDDRRQRLGSLARALNAVSPLAVLERGYAVVRDPEGQALTEKKQFTKGKKINILLDTFEVDAKVENAPRKASLK